MTEPRSIIEECIANMEEAENVAYTNMVEAQEQLQECDRESMDWVWIQQDFEDAEHEVEFYQDEIARLKKCLEVAVS